MGKALFASPEDPSFRVRTTKSPVRPSSRAWASCTSRSSSTACAASSTSSQRRRAPGGLSRGDPQGRRQEGAFVKQSGGRGQYGHVCHQARTERNRQGLRIVDAVKGGVVPRKYIPAVDKGIHKPCRNGVRRFPGDRRQVALFDGSTTMSTRTKTRSRWPARWRSRGSCHAAPARCRARTDDGGRGRKTPEDYGQRGATFVRASRYRSGHGRRPRRHEGDQRRGPACRDVRLRDPAAFAEPGCATYRWSSKHSPEAPKSVGRGAVTQQEVTRFSYSELTENRTWRRVSSNGRTARQRRHHWSSTMARPR